MFDEQEPPPEFDEHSVDLVEETLERARHAHDLVTMAPAEFDAFMAGYNAGRAAGRDDGYAEGYAACDREMARLQRAAVESTRRGDPFPFMTTEERP